MRLKRLALIAALLAPAAACSSIPDADIRVPDIKALTVEGLQSTKPIAGTIAVAPVKVEIPTSGSEDYNPAAIADPELFQERIVHWLNKSGLTNTAVALVVDKNSSVDQQAWDAGADFIIEATITDIKPSFQGHHWSWVPNIVNWLFWMVPAWYVASEEYALDIETKLSVRFIDAEESVYSNGGQRLKETARGRFDEFDRGWRLFGFAMLLSPVLNNDGNWSEVASKLYPAAASRAAQRVVENLDLEFRVLADKNSYQLNARRTFAMVIGLGKYKDRENFTGDPKLALGATKLAEVLTNRYAERTVRSYIDETATESKILEGFAQLEARARPEDEVLIYIATRCRPLVVGEGEAEGESVRLLLYDAEPQTIRGIISAKKLGELAGKIKGKVSVFVETDLSDTRFKRKKVRELFDDLTKSGASLLIAAQPGESLAEVEYPYGLFGYHLISAFERAEKENYPRADINRDRLLTLEEIAGYVGTRVRSDAGIRGKVQTPTLEYGKSN